MSEPAPNWVLLGSRFVILLSVIVFLTLQTVFTQKKVMEKRENSAVNFQENDDNETLAHTRTGFIELDNECEKIARAIYKKDGSVADIAIATMLCKGIVSPQNSGIGGGFLLTIYIKSSGKIEVLNAREEAPMAASRDMFERNSSQTLKGGIAVAIPGEMKGYWTLYKKYGKLPWFELIIPSVNLCYDGIVVTDSLAQILEKKQNEILESPSLRSIFVNSVTNKVWNAGDKIRRPNLAKTLWIIAKEGGDVLYSESLGAYFVEDIRTLNGIITLQDMEQYSAKWEKPIVINYEQNQIYAPSWPGSGIVLSVILNILNNFLPENIDDPLTWHRIVESFKFAYGVRSNLNMSLMNNSTQKIPMFLTNDFIMKCREKISNSSTVNDPTYYSSQIYSNAEDHNLEHLSVMALNGDAISITSSLNSEFGAMVESPTTGIILNDQMNSFSRTNSSQSLLEFPGNKVEPKKRPFSSMVPTIVVNKQKNIKMVTGATGGLQLTTTVALKIIHHLKFGQSIQNAIERKRIHHQLIPMEVKVEEGFNQEIIEELKKKNHTVTFMT